jgi:hypothetical protein
VRIVKHFPENTDTVSACCFNSSLREAFIKCENIYITTVNTSPKKQLSPLRTAYLPKLENHISLKKIIHSVDSPFGCRKMANSSVYYFISVSIFRLSYPVITVISM